MTDVATLGLAVDTSDLKSAKNELAQFSNAAKVAQRATSDLSSASGRFSSAEIKAMSAAMGAVERSSNAAAKALAAASLAAQRAGAVGASGVKALGQASGAARAQVQNLAYQVQDIATMLAMGQSPFMLLAQQLPQVTQHGGKLSGVMAAIKQTLLGLVSPLGLLTTGFVLLASAAISYFSSSSSAADKADEAWKQHGEIIKSLKAAFGEAAEGLTDYVTRSQVELAAAGRAGLETLKASAVAARTAFVDSFLPNGSLWGRSAVDQQFMPFKSALEDFRVSARNGAPDFAGLRSEVERLVATDPAGLRSAGDAIINASSAAADAERKVRAAEGAISMIGGTASGQVGGVNELAKALNELAGIAVPALTQTEQALGAYRKAMAAAQGGEDRNSARAAYEAALARISNQDPTVINSDGNMTSVPVPGQRPVTLGDRASGGGSSAKQKAYASETISIKEQTRALEAQNAAQAALNPLVQDYGYQQAKVRAATDLLLAAERDKRQITPQLIADINSMSDAYARQVEQQNKVAEAARRAQKAEEDAEERRRYWRDITRAGIDDLFAGLEEGKSFWQSMGDVAVNTLKRIADTMLDDLLDAIFQVNTAGKNGGGGIFSGLFAGLFGGAGKGAFPFAPGASGVPMYAEGGLLSGPGTGTSDSILARLSNGEFIVNANATKNFLPLLHAINDNKLAGFAPGFAEGGLASKTPGGESGPEMIMERKAA